MSLVAVPIVLRIDKGRMLWSRLNERDHGLRIHACDTLLGTYRNFTEL